MNYMKPTTCVVKMKNKTHLLQGTGNEHFGGSDSREYRSGWKDEE